ncbi:MAG: hypothetical protein ACM33T_16030 [Solirubrobacterales bacterium]
MTGLEKVPSRQRLDFEDRLMEMPIDIGKWVWPRIWAFSDRLFRLVAWMTVIAGLAAVVRKAGSPTAAIAFLIFLTTVWILAFSNSVLTMGTLILDSLKQHILPEEEPKKLDIRRILIVFAIGLPVTIVVALAFQAGFEIFILFNHLLDQR